MGPHCAIVQRDGRNSIHFICHRHTRCVAGKFLSFVYDCFALFLFTSANAENNVFFSIPSLAVVSKLMGALLISVHIVLYKDFGCQEQASARA